MNETFFTFGCPCEHDGAKCGGFITAQGDDGVNMLPVFTSRTLAQLASVDEFAGAELPDIIEVKITRV